MREKEPNSICWDRVARARARLKFGFYDDPEIERDLIGGSIDGLLEALQNCPVGNGNAFREIVAASLAYAFRSIVDIPLIRREVRIDGGRVDVELPLRIEELDRFPLWRFWQSRYSIRSILIETKNLRKRATNKDVSQLVGYLENEHLGRFGILASVNGFTREASKAIASLARHGRKLILPIDRRDLTCLLRLSTLAPASTMQLLRRKEALLG